VQLIRTTGFAYACTTAPGVTRAQSDPFQLPRLRVGAWEADEFQRRLAEWLPTA
jgi:hypothetical protein